MKSALRKTFCILLACVFLFAAAFPAFAGTPAEDAHLHFNADGRFRILNFSDIQDDESLDSRVTTFIRQAVYTACPDLIVLTGDNIYGSDVGSGQTGTAIAQYMNIFESLGIPVAIVFGNHDDNGSALSKEAQMQIYNSYSVDISYDEGDSMAGCGTYNVPIYGSTETDSVKFNLWMFDTGSSINQAVSSKYDYMRADQLQWYVSKSNELKEANGGVLVPSIAFQHIIVNDIYDALQESSGSGAVSYDGKSYVLPDTAAPGSIMREHPCPSGNENETEFSVLKQQGDVIAIVSGHDHRNMFVVPHQGIDLINTPAAGFYETKVLGMVFYHGDDDTRGARIIDVYEDTGSYTTDMLILQDLAKTEVYTPTSTNLYSTALREAYFNADKLLKHPETLYSETSVARLQNAMAQADLILRDLNDDRRTSTYDQGDIEYATQQIVTCMQNLETASILVTFDANGGTCSEASRTIRYGEPCGELPDAQRSHYNLDGWFTEREGGVQITADTVFTTLSDQTVYAHWSRDNQRIPGDVDGDYNVDLRDIVLIQRHIAGGWGESPNRLNFDNADVNADGKISLLDVMLLRRYVAGGWNVELV